MSLQCLAPQGCPNPIESVFITRWSDNGKNEKNARPKAFSDDDTIRIEKKINGRTTFEDILVRDFWGKK